MSSSSIRKVAKSVIITATSETDKAIKVTFIIKVSLFFLRDICSFMFFLSFVYDIKNPPKRMLFLLFFQKNKYIIIIQLYWNFVNKKSPFFNVFFDCFSTFFNIKILKAQGEKSLRLFCDFLLIFLLFSLKNRKSNARKISCLLNVFRCRLCTFNVTKNTKNRRTASAHHRLLCAI